MAKEGLTARITRGGLPVVRVHYSSDERKDPSTPEGAKWLAETIQGYPLGLADPSFQKEMEIVYGALGGQVLFQYWEDYKKSVVIPPFPVLHEPHVKFYGSYDHGWVHPSVYHVHAVFPDGRKLTVWEFAGAKVPMRAIAEIIKGHDVKLVQDGRVFPGNPYAGKEIIKVCDPQIFAATGNHGDDPFHSVGDVFRDKYGVSFQSGHKGGSLTVAEYLIGDLWLDLTRPKYQIFNTCARLLFELPRLRYRPMSPQVARNKGAPESLVDKDDDAFDSLCQFLRQFPHAVAPKPPKSMAGTFAWHQAHIKSRKRLQNTYSRR